MLRGLNKDKANPGKAAAEDMQYIVDMAQNAPFAMQALTDSFVKFRSAGLDPTDGSLKALVDSVARFGGDSELLKRAAVAVQQMSGKGVVSMEELRQQLGEAVPNAMKAMADAAGITMGELTKAVSSGTVEAKQALSLMFVGLRAENENAAKDMMQTYTGALAQLQTSFTLFADRVGQTGYLDSLSKGMKELASIMNSAEGISFANSLGSGLTTAIDGLRQLAQWLAKNQELVINLGKVVAAMVAFKLMRAGIMGVVGAGSQMVSTFATMATAIQTPFNLGATAVTRFNRAARMGLAPIPSLIFAIRGAITGLKGAFAGLTAFIAANPIGAAFTVATVAVAGLITYMTMLRSETSKVVDEIRKIPEAMTAAKRAQMADRAEKLEKQILADQRALKTGESVNYVSNSAGVITHKESKADIEARLKKNQEEYQKIWDGTFKLLSSSNPAWILFDLLTNARYGLGQYVSESMIDLGQLYQIGRYCDEEVDDGFGGKEKRFAINTQITSRQDAYRLIQDIAGAFRGMVFWAGGMVNIMQDSPSDPVMMFTNSNVKDGLFTYKGSARKDRPSVALVTYNNKEDGYKQNIEYVEDQDAMRRYGERKTEVVAFGCTSRGQAHRVGLWLLYTARMESDVITFTAGLDASFLMPGETVLIQNKYRAGKRNSGRIVAFTKNSVTLDAPVSLAKGGCFIRILNQEGKIVERDALETGENITKVTFSKALSSAETPVLNGVWTITEPDLEPMRVRIVNIAQGETSGKGTTYRDPDLNSTRSTGVGGTLYAAFNNVTSRTVAVTVKVTSSSQTHIYSPVMLISRGSGAFSMSGIS